LAANESAGRRRWESVAFQERSKFKSRRRNVGGRVWKFAGSDDGPIAQREREGRGYSLGGVWRDFQSAVGRY